MADARRAGFDACFNMDAINVRCRRRGVMFEEFGPYEAAVDLKGSDGQGGFDEVILWHIRDNDDVFKVKDMLKERGWSECWTGTDRAGDQAILTREGSPVRVFMDLSYYAKRRLRFVPEWNKRERRCTPTADPTTS